MCYLDGIHLVFRISTGLLGIRLVDGNGYLTPDASMLLEHIRFWNPVEVGNIPLA